MKDVLFWTVGVGVALATLPLGWWGIPIILFYAFVVGTKIGMFDWQELKNYDPFNPF